MCTYVDMEVGFGEDIAEILDGNALRAIIPPRLQGDYHLETVE